MTSELFASLTAEERNEFSFIQVNLKCDGCRANLVTEGSRKCGTCITCRGLAEPYAHNETYPDPDFEKMRKDRGEGSRFLRTHSL